MDMATEIGFQKRSKKAPLKRIGSPKKRGWLQPVKKLPTTPFNKDEDCPIKKPYVPSEKNSLCFRKIPFLLKGVVERTS